MPTEVQFIVKSPLHRVGDGAQLVEGLPSMHKALALIPSATYDKARNKNKRQRTGEVAQGLAAPATKVYNLSLRQLRGSWCIPETHRMESEN